MANKQKITISVIGGHAIDYDVEEASHNVGFLIGKMGHVLVCGGLSGVMEAASRGAKEAGGLTIGLLPGKDKADANDYIDIALPTTIGFARNAMVAASGDIVIALPGSFGTSSEISYSLVYGRPVIDFGGWDIPGTIKVNNLKELEEKIRELIDSVSRET